MQTLAPTWNVGHTATAKWYVRLFPSLDDIAFLLPMFVLFARFNGTQLLFSDGDTGWHIRTGQWILAHHAVPTVDLFSFTKPNAPWFAWEWAWDVLAAVVHQYAGLAGIGFITTALLGAFSLLVYRLCLRVSHDNVLSMAVTALTAAVSSIHWLARPHLVSWIFALLFLNLLESIRTNGASASTSLLLILLPALTVVWTNLHGGFVAGLMLIACYALGEGLTALFAAQTSDGPSSFRSAWQACRPYGLSFALCAAATLVNPYGWQLHKHIYAYLSDSELLDKIQEFQSISFHAAPAIYLEILLLLAVFAVVQNLRHGRLTPVLLICLWAHLALLSARHIPLFAIVAAPYVAAVLSASVGNLRQMPLLAEAAETFSDICHDLRALELTPRLHLTSAAALLGIAGLFALGEAPFLPQFNSENFPLQAVPVLEKHLSSRVFSTDQWSDYLIYRFYPAQRVFFDGRSDFYGNDFVKVNQRILSAEHDWKSLLHQYSIDLVLVKPETPLSAVLKLTPGVKVLFDDGKVILFAVSGMNMQPLLPRPLTQVSSNSDRASRAPGSAQTTQPDLSQAALTTNRPNNSKKGKTS
jgi:hypothetical protein